MKRSNVAIVTLLATALGFLGGSYANRPTSAAASVAPTPEPSSPLFDPTLFHLRILPVPIGNDDTPIRVATDMQSRLPVAWNAATRGRSRVTIEAVELESPTAWRSVPSTSIAARLDHMRRLASTPATTPNAVIVVFDAGGADRQAGWGGALVGARLVVIHELSAGAPDEYLRSVLHELGHVLGCCVGAGSDGGGHAICRPEASIPSPNIFATSLPGPQLPLMCPDGGTALAFSDYELVQIGMGKP